ncbi:MAG: cytochrome c5 [Candidatus Azotimanducaceae bacterium]|jgi:cytochrome c5
MKMNIMKFRPICFTTALLMLVGSHPVFAEMTVRQSLLMVNNCFQCHTNSKIDAPLIGDVTTWAKYREKGEAEMLKNVVQGIRGMPPYGYCSACSEEDLTVLMRTIAGIPDTPDKKPEE